MLKRGSSSMPSFHACRYAVFRFKSVSDESPRIHIVKWRSFTTEVIESTFDHRDRAWVIDIESSEYCLHKVGLERGSAKM